MGVSDEALLVNKTLSELIEPLEVRMRNIAEFIEDIKPGQYSDYCADNFFHVWIHFKVATSEMADVYFLAQHVVKTEDS